MTQLLANAARWVGHGAGRILVDNEAGRDVLLARGISDVDVVATNGDSCECSVDLSGYAAIVVQVNEWGTSRIALADIAHLRAFVQGGGGLVIAGSALHWSWWLTSYASEFPGDTLIKDAGIRWNVDSFLDIAGAVAELDPLAIPLSLWNAYVSGAAIADVAYVALAPMFANALETGVDIGPAIARLVRETPPLPASADSPQARLSASVIAAKAAACSSRWASATTSSTRSPRSRPGNARHTWFERSTPTRTWSASARPWAARSTRCCPKARCGPASSISRSRSP